MERVYKIECFEKFLQHFLGSNIQILEYGLKPLTAAGENYGSQILSLDLKIKNKEKEKTLNLVAKMCPPNEYLQELFDSSVTFKKEIAVYTKILPALVEFQKEQGLRSSMDFFPRCYGARLSLNPDSESVDGNALLILENLKFLGFKVEDRMKGFDLESARLILKDLATFHAVPIALKLLKPDVFDKQIRSYLCRNTIFDGLSEKGFEMELDLVTKTAQIKEELELWIPKLIKLMETGFENFKLPAAVREPFGTISHNDYWVNNTMIKYESGKPVLNKMLDFQLIDYGSPANDLVFFLFTSLQSCVLQNNFDELIEFYFEEFMDILIKLGCHPSLFSLELFNEEIENSLKTREFFHIIVMLRHVLAIKGTAKELHEVTEEDLSSEESVSEECKNRILQIILFIVKKNWI